MALMRVLEQRPAIFILDQASAGIDPCTAWQILQALDLLQRGTTSIRIAHRFSAVKSADCISVMEKA